MNVGNLLKSLLMACTGWRNKAAAAAGDAAAAAAARAGRTESPAGCTAGAIAAAAEGHQDGV